MTRVAAVDCGTNSIRLLVADVDPSTGGLVELDRRMTIVRLGQGVDRTGRLAPEALERTFAACREYAGIIKEYGVEAPSAGGGGGRIRFVATSASRDAENRDEFVNGVAGILGVEPEVISGDQEAEFSFTGATKGLPGHEERLVVDIGGGSTEFVIGRGRVEAARSVDIGCVRLTERHVRSDPPAPEEIAAVRADIEAALDLAGRTVPIREASTLVGLAGSVTTVAGIALGLDAYDSEAIHHARISRDRVAEITERLVRSTHDERAAIPVMHPGRVDVIVAGALVLLAIMDRAGVPEVVVSEHDILDGIALSLV
ncbi:Ppx/GppA phosphatase family protein [Streptomyces tirandamycinicus]|uniref:Ppx/GppA family phosphatase n=1 Tax=Streptomyces tirandamycinicus TaxID=2174846 RepID=A0A2S1SSX1_9ACTN|nr:MULTISPECIES: Ppx/GppA phosphatase family protein [Streptomyces]AWI29407.1 Ppx/GppA family phosphatase [Streptomyces tirandamycinicus]MCY0981260.1 Ppx/GppA phosphatase family protein [Streptomyces tirandamycinicus]NNJ08326.1 Ppx/GppA family phosphatase [Streptomyces sp. PKU-MA01144]